MSKSRIDRLSFINLMYLLYFIVNDINFLCTNLQLIILGDQ